MPRGFYQIAFEVPPGELALQQPFWSIAQKNYSRQEYGYMAAAGADTVRIQVAQTGVDDTTTTGLYSQTFVQQVIGAVVDARAAGLNVILSMQDEPQTGEPDKQISLPDSHTQEGWKNLLASPIATDAGVLLEIYNEPHVGPQSAAPNPPTDWSGWANAMNQTIAAIRADGARNVLLADGLQYAHELTGSPTLSDPLGQTAYAAHVHPRNSGEQDPTEWSAEFGNFASGAPLIVTEWGIGYHCDSGTAQSVVNFLQYLHDRGIGVVASAWDWHGAGFGSARYDFPDGKFSSFVDANGAPLPCGASSGTIGYTNGFGIGLTTEAYFTTGTPPTTIK